MAASKIDVEGTLRTIFRRCVLCPSEAPSCPACPSGQSCSLQAQSCTTCASTTCLDVTAIPGLGGSQQSTPVGAIAGGVAGGVAVIVALTYLFYRSCIRNRRRRQQEWIDQKVEKRDPNTLSHTDRQSARSVGSIASTVLTRASNVIQIAYIPGVTNRTPPDSPAHLVPPVPSLPFGSASSSPATTPHMEQDMHFFMPGDLRDSKYSNMSDDPRISLAPSLARASVATTIYRNDVVVSPFPAQQAFRTKPAVVSVKNGSSSASSSTPTIPPVPQVPRNITGSSIVARNVTARPIEVKKANSGNRVPTLGNLARANSQKSQQSSVASPTSETSQGFWQEKEVVMSPRSQTTVIEDTSPASPFMQPKQRYNSFNSFNSGTSSVVSGGSPLREVSSSRNLDGELNAMIEDAMRSAARDITHMGLGSGKASRPELRKQDSGPFSDANEVKENII